MPSDAEQFTARLRELCVQVPDGIESQVAARAILLSTISELIDVSIGPQWPAERKRRTYATLGNSLQKLRDLIDTEQSPCLD
jgi:hypothetical protein